MSKLTWCHGKHVQSSFHHFLRSELLVAWCTTVVRTRTSETNYIIQ